MRVKWMDPGIKDYETPEDIYWAINRVFIVDDIDDDEEDEDRMVHLSEEDGWGEAEAWEHELVVV